MIDSIKYSAGKYRVAGLGIGCYLLGIYRVSPEYILPCVQPWSLSPSDTTPLRLRKERGERGEGGLVLHQNYTTSIKVSRRRGALDRWITPWLLRTRSGQQSLDDSNKPSQAIPCDAIPIPMRRTCLAVRRSPCDLRSRE